MDAESASTVSFEPHIQALLDRLHQASTTQESRIDRADAKYKAIVAAADRDPDAGVQPFDELMADKFIALDRDKCVFMHQLIVATGATTVVEVGTSFGVSTIYLALAVAENARRVPGRAPKVIATEKEEGKAAAARRHWAEAGAEVEQVIDFRVGDLRETLKDGVPPVDFVLMDIWPFVARPALDLLVPRLRDGAVVLTDNTVSSAPRYGDLFALLRDPNGPFSTLCMPFAGGLDFSIYRR